MGCPTLRRGRLRPIQASFVFLLPFGLNGNENSVLFRGCYCHRVERGILGEALAFRTYSAFILQDSAICVARRWLQGNMCEWRSRNRVGNAERVRVVNGESGRPNDAQAV